MISLSRIVGEIETYLHGCNEMYMQQKRLIEEQQITIEILEQEIRELKYKLYRESK